MMHPRPAWRTEERSSRSRIMSKERRGGRGSCSLTPKSQEDPVDIRPVCAVGRMKQKATASNGGRHALRPCKTLAYCQIQSGFPPTRNQISEWWFHSNGLVISALDVADPLFLNHVCKDLVPVPSETSLPATRTEARISLRTIFSLGP